MAEEDTDSGLIDEGCVELARKFLKGSKHEGDEASEQELSAEIQLAIEEWVAEN